ncbi:stress response transcriptional regulator NmlR [Streptococcus loxodontisalivarius]|uniref:DNA-binding transcriptional MerR regulator n=1 Tax=Streptococcus loxodontisalivarius TaxID=1349415 RepID=A0ABS2PTK0_9STRE|nr:stress response transcriptional regulator NmlR [Streptococcus loxodontisalivarius]MBM7642697.1 DNA-binding transcriptional MerR regulator [Streptococcus loxodontisalivarius]
MNIKSASQQLDISADTIRYYERIGLVPPITRTASGIRDFQEEDLAALEFVKCFRAAGVSVESLIDYMTLFPQGEETREARLSILLEEREKMAERLEDLQAALDRLDGKIQAYKEGKIK